MSDADREPPSQPQAEGVSRTDDGARSAVRGAVITMAGRGVRLLCQMVGLVVIARFVSPTEYGLVAMAGAVVGLAGVLGDFGSLSALRSPDLSREDRNSLFWFSTGLSAVLAVLTAATAPALAHFYGRPEITPIVLSLSPLFILNGASSQYRVDAMIRRKYVWVTAADAGSAIAGVAAGVAAAVYGLGYWTLVLQNWVVAAVGLVMIVWACRWAPGWPARNANLRSHVGFSFYSSMTQVTSYLSSNANAVALGRFLGPEAVGMYSRAYQLFALPVSQITAPLTSVVLPILARVDPPKLPEVLHRIQRLLVYGVLGICLVVAVGGAPLATVLLGARWAQAGDLVQVLMIGAVFQLSGYVYYWAFMTTGRANLLFRYEVPARLVMTVLVVFGASYGEMGAAWGHSAGLVVCWLIPATFGMRSLGWRIAPLALGSARPVLLYLWAFAVGAAVREATQRSGFDPIAVVSLTFVATAAAMLPALLVPAYRRDASELVGLAATLVRRAKPAA